MLSQKLNEESEVEFGSVVRNLKELTQIKKLIVGVMLDVSVKNAHNLKKAERDTYETSMRLVFIFSKVKDFIAKFKLTQDRENVRSVVPSRAAPKEHEIIAMNVVYTVLKRLHNLTVIKCFTWPSKSHLFRSTTQLRVLGH